MGGSPRADFAGAAPARCRIDRPFGTDARICAGFEVGQSAAQRDPVGGCAGRGICTDVFAPPGGLFRPASQRAGGGAHRPHSAVDEAPQARSLQRHGLHSFPQRLSEVQADGRNCHRRGRCECESALGFQGALVVAVCPRGPRSRWLQAPSPAGQLQCRRVRDGRSRAGNGSAGESARRGRLGRQILRNLRIGLLPRVL